MSNCRNCQHWKPYWTGEHWDVRSFIDAPESEREAILTALKERGELDTYEILDTLNNVPDVARNTEHERAGVGSDWPEWGECKLTEMESKETTMARAIDGSEFMAVLRCHANFGCVQFKGI